MGGGGLICCAIPAPRQHPCSTTTEMLPVNSRATLPPAGYPTYPSIRGIPLRSYDTRASLPHLCYPITPATLPFQPATRPHPCNPTIPLPLYHTHATRAHSCYQTTPTLPDHTHAPRPHPCHSTTPMLPDHTPATRPHPCHSTTPMLPDHTHAPLLTIETPKVASFFVNMNTKNSSKKVSTILVAFDICSYSTGILRHLTVVRTSRALDPRDTPAVVNNEQLQEQAKGVCSISVPK